MDYMDISKRRCTVRRFSPEPVPRESVLKILEAGRWAPTAVNAQPQRVLVLESEEELAKVREFCTFGYDRKYAELSPEAADEEHGRNVYYYGAPLVLLVCYDREACWRHPQTGESSGATDATIVAVNMMMEAVSLGLGTAWISYFDSDKARALLSVPDSWETVCMLYVGRPAEGWSPNRHLSGERRPLEDTCFLDGRRPRSPGGARASELLPAELLPAELLILRLANSTACLPERQ